MDANEPELKALLPPGTSCDVAIPPAGCPPKNTYRFPGGNIGGPVLLPHSDFNRNRDKMFFFFGYEYFQQHVTSFPFLNAIVPTQAMRNGDFSGVGVFGQAGVNQVPMFPQRNSDGSIFIDPATNNPVMLPVTNFAAPIGSSGGCPANTPSAACSIDPGGSILMNLLPLPNADPTKTPGGVNYVSAPIFAQPMHQITGRVDYSISDNTKLFVRDNLQKETQNFPLGLWWHFGNNVPYPGGVSAKNISHAISTSLTHVFNPTLTNETLFGFTFINFPNRIVDPSKVSRKALGYPYTGIYWDPKVDRVPSAWNDGGAWQWMPGGFNPELFAKKYEVSFADNLVKVYRTHTLKFGFFWEEVTNNQPNSPWDQGLIHFTNGGASAASNLPGFSTGNTYADELLGHVTGGYSDDTIANLHNEAFRTAEWYANDDWKLTPRVTLQLGARFSHLPEWWDRTGNGFAIFDKSKYIACAPSDTACLASLPGVLWHKKDPSVSLSGRSVKWLFVTPRVGIAYDLFGTGKTVLRSGFGMYRWHWSQTNPGQDISAGFKSAGFGGNLGFLMSQIATYQPAISRTGVGVMDTADTQPLVYNWNFTIDQRLPGSMMWELGYVGNASRNLISSVYPPPNLVPYGAMFGHETDDPDACPSPQADGVVRCYRQFQDYVGVIGTQGYQGYSNYESLQTQLKRQRGRINYTVSYTWSKALGTQVGYGDPTNLASAYKPLDFDRTHIFNVAYIIQLPDIAKKYGVANNKAGRGILDGWQLSGISQYASSVNLASASSFNGSWPGANNIVVNGSPDFQAMARVVCDPGKGLAPNQYINPNCFAAPTPGQNGPWSVPYYLRGPAYINHDLALFKNWQIGESKKFQFRFSAYNFPNHPLKSFGVSNPNLSLGSKDFGFADNALGHRILELAFKFYY